MLVSAYGKCSKTCLPWQGRVYINDAFMDWSGDTRYEDGVKYGRSQYCGKWFPLLSSAIAEGLFHPNCRHGIGLYIDGVSELPEPMDNTEIERRYKEEQRQRALERDVRKAKRKVEGFMEPADIQKAKADLREAQKDVRDYINETNAAEGERVLVRKPIQEKIYGDAPPRIGSSAAPYEPPKKPVQSSEGFAAEVDIPAPENQTVQYTDQKIPERFKSAEVEENKAAKPEAEIEEGNVNNQSIDISEESGIINKKISDHTSDFYAESDAVFDMEKVDSILDSSFVGRDTVEYFTEHGMSAEIYYNYDSYGVAGEIQNGRISLYALYNDDEEELASTIIHEVSHERFGWSGTQEAEVNCYLMEVMHKKNGIVTHDDISEIVAFVEKNYSYLPKGDLYGF